MKEGRGGRTQIRTALRLSKDLAVPVYYILLGKAQAAFPESATPCPSSFVQIVRVGRIHTDGVLLTPVWVNWRQWESVLVPVLQDPMFSARIGSLGGQTGTGVSYDDQGNLVPSSPRSIPAIQLGPGVLACKASLRASLIDQIEQAIYTKAVAVGY